jgi:hypothetical protein
MKHPGSFILQKNPQGIYPNDGAHGKNEAGNGGCYQYQYPRPTLRTQQANASDKAQQ